VATTAWWPGKIKPGTISEHIAAGWDLLPTLCELSGTETPKGLDGVSFAPTLLGKKNEQEKREFLYWEFHERGGKQAVRMGKWKGIRLNVRKDPDSPIELYDLSKDIGEENNIASRHPQIVKKVESAMKESHVESPIFPFIK
jgi:arylsulfatase A-like enzyme